MTANRDYMREYRRNNPRVVERNRERNRAYNAALRELARRHSLEFAHIYKEAKAALGVESIPMGRPRKETS